MAPEEDDLQLAKFQQVCRDLGIFCDDARVGDESGRQDRASIWSLAAEKLREEVREGEEESR
jgi:hypothetical protein